MRKLLLAITIMVTCLVTSLSFAGHDKGRKDKSPSKQNYNRNPPECGQTIELPAGCSECPTNVACEIEIVKRHEISYDVFRMAIENYSHIPSSRIGKNNVIWELQRGNCYTHRIALTGDHDLKQGNDEITLKTVLRIGFIHSSDITVFYEIPFFNGLLALQAKAIHFYKGELEKVPGIICKDILVEVVYPDRIAYYDLSDSEGDK